MDPNPVRKAIEVAGGVTKFASGLGVTPQRVTNWVSRGVPAEWCPSVEALVDGAVRCEELRPDIPWSVLRQAA